MKGIESVKEAHMHIFNYSGTLVVHYTIELGNEIVNELKNIIRKTLGCEVFIAARHMNLIS